jgi:ABC-type transporter Mla subunit MlaD
MTEETKQPEQSEQAADSQQATADAWRDVGKQFEALGKSLAAAARAAWEDETNRRHLEQMQAGLEQMADDMGKALKSAATAVEDETVKASVKEAAKSVRAAGEQTLGDARPYLTYALRQTREGLQALIDRLEQDVADMEAPPEEKKAE